MLTNTRSLKKMPHKNSLSIERASLINFQLSIIYTNTLKEKERINPHIDKIYFNQVS